MSPTQSGPTEREARKVAEAARESEWIKPSFGKELFLGRLRLDLVDPWPTNSPEQVAAGEAFLERLRVFIEGVDGAAIEESYLAVTVYDPDDDEVVVAASDEEEEEDEIIADDEDELDDDFDGDDDDDGDGDDWTDEDAAEEF